MVLTSSVRCVLVLTLTSAIWCSRRSVEQVVLLARVVTAMMVADAQAIKVWSVLVVVSTLGHGRDAD